MKEMRFSAASKDNPMGDLIMRALSAHGSWSINAMREPGFRQMAEVEQEFFRAAGGSFRALAPLPDKAQVMLDKVPVKVGMQRLSFVKELLARNLTTPISDPLGVTQLEWNSINKVAAAQRTMSPAARGENKMPIMLPNRLPIYLTTDRFEIDIRTLKMSQRIGMPLDTTLAEMCFRSVNEAFEDAAINGATTLDGQNLQVAGYTAPGLLNAPNALAKVLTAAAWTTVPVGTTVYNETQAMVQQLKANNKFGPYALVVGTLTAGGLDGDYVTAAPQNTIRERLLKIDGLESIIVADMMPATKVALVQMTSDVVDIVVGQMPTIIPWTSLDGFMINNLIMGIMIPRFRSDQKGQSGIVVGTLT